MKPLEGMYQTATQVKVLSPEIINIEKADSFHLLEGSTKRAGMVRCDSLLRGLRPWYSTEWKLSEPGRPNLIPKNRISGNDLKKGESGECRLGVGLTHSRGVTGVMSCEPIRFNEVEGHSKGLALICKGEGKRSPVTELEELWKQN